VTTPDAVQKFGHVLPRVSETFHEHNQQV
jgi:hypothetical protein